MPVEVQDGHHTSRLLLPANPLGQIRIPSGVEVAVGADAILRQQAHRLLKGTVRLVDLRLCGERLVDGRRRDRRSSAVAAAGAGVAVASDATAGRRRVRPQYGSDAIGEQLARIRAVQLLAGDELAPLGRHAGQVGVRVGSLCDLGGWEKREIG